MRSCLALQEAVAANPFALLPHRPNYALLAAYNFAHPNEEPFEQQSPGGDNALARWEAKFQISLKVPIAYDLFNDKGHRYFGYTNRAFWQL